MILTAPRILHGRLAQASGAQNRMNMDVVWWVVSTVLILIGIAGTVLPALPGPLFVLLGVALAAWIEGFSRVGTVAVVIVGVLAVMAWVLDYAAGMMGAKKVGASKQALVGAAVGTVVGLFMGFVGVLFMPLVGAALGEYLARRDEQHALKVGVATWLGILAGLAAKVVIVFMMVGVYLAALVL
jgi:uncharacterized protein YqgC (DUF456 family)